MAGLPHSALVPHVPPGQENTMKCSYCHNHPSGGPPGHLYKSCLLFCTGKPSLNPRWNYAASGPANFQVAAQQQHSPLYSGPAGWNMGSPMPFPPISTHSPYQPRGQMFTDVEAMGQQQGLGILNERMRRIEAREAAVMERELKEAEDKAKEEDRMATVTAVRKELASSTSETVRMAVSPIKKTLKMITDHYGEFAATPTPQVRVPKRKFGVPEIPPDLNSDGVAPVTSLFTYEEGVEGITTCFKTNTAVMFALFAVKTPEDFDAWAAKHLTERSDRAGAFLLDFGQSQGMKKYSKAEMESWPKMIAKVAATYKLPA